MEVEWMPFELRPYPQPTLKPEGEYLQKAWQQSVYPTAESFGTKMVLPKVSPQPYTHLAFEGYQMAKEQGKGNEYNHRMLTAFFQDELNIGDIDVLTQLAGEIGLNEQEYREALETRKYKKVHQEALRHAYEEANIQAVPTFYINERKLQGLYSRESLEQVIQQELKKTPSIHKDGLVCGIDGCE